jgi:hypothetical protein
MFKNRSVIEIMVLVFAFTVASSVVLTGTVIIILTVVQPTRDVDNIVRALTSIVSGMLGALLGLLAGKSEGMGLNNRPDGADDQMPSSSLPDDPSPR